MSKEKKAVMVASFTAILLIIIKGIAWIFTWSMAIITSAIDSSLDFWVSLMNYFAIKKSEEKEDEHHNYWHWKIEWFWAIFEGMIIFISWILVIYFSIEKIIKKDLLTKTDESIVIMLVSIILTYLLVTYLDKIAKQTNSLILKADSLHYRSDLITNSWIIISLILIKIFSLPIIDPIISILIAIYIMYWSIWIINEWYKMLMDHKIDDEYLEIIKNTILNEEEIESYHMLKTRQSWKKNIIEFHIVFKDTDISLKRAHTISDAIENTIIENIPHSIVMIHLDYFDDSQYISNPKIK